MPDIDENFRFLLVETQRQIEAARAVVAAPSEAAVAKIEARDDYLDNLKSVIENASYARIHGERQLPDMDVIRLRAMNVATSNLERVGDHAVNVARQTRYLKEPAFPGRFDPAASFAEVQKALSFVSGALLERDMAQAMAICRAELRLDTLYKDAFDRIREELASGGDTWDLLTTLFIFRYLERMGDALLNVGEAAIFAITGEKFKIRQLSALEDALAASGQGEALSGVEFTSIWGTRSGCRIGRVHGHDKNDKPRDVIFKDGAPDKLKVEADNIARWERLWPGLPPRVEALREHKKSTTMLIETLSGETIQDLVLAADPGRLRTALSTLAATLMELWPRTRTEVPIGAGFMRQLRGRLAETLRVHPDFDQEEKRLGRAVFPSPRALMDKAEAIEAACPAPFSIFIHGDFNANNIIYDAEVGRIHYIDLHRSADSDYVQDVSVFLLSQFRLPAFDSERRRIISRVCRDFFAFAADFAASQGDRTFETRLALGLARSFCTSTRFELSERFARVMWQRGVFLLRTLAGHAGPAPDYRMPRDILDL